jgi:phosphoglycerate-specific signal transduction histidine kinase
MTTASDPTTATARRPWYRSIAGKLLFAFALIAALTVSASWLSLFRFNEIDAAMNRLTGVSIPLVELSLGVESKAAELVVLATQVGNAEDETQRFERMDRLSDQIGHLWSTLGNLQSIISEEAAAARLQELVAAINTKVGELDRSTREVLLLRGRKDRTVAQAVAVNEVGMRGLLQMTDDLLARMAGDLNRLGPGEPNLAGLQ